MIHSSPLKRGSAFRQILRMTTSWLVMTLSVILGAAGTVAAFFGAALLLNSSFALFLVALSVGFLMAFAGAWSAARMMRQARPGRIALGVGAATMLVLTLVASLTFLQPLPSTPAAHQPPPAPAGVRYWNLSTRSHIVYLKIPAQGRAKSTPIILVGGVQAKKMSPTRRRPGSSGSWPASATMSTSTIKSVVASRRG